MTNSNNDVADSPLRQIAGQAEEQIIRQAREGCVQSQGELYERCRQYLLLIANQELNADLLAKLGPSDVVQETLLKAQRHLPRFEGQSERELRAWLRQILLNCLYDASRRFRAGSKRDVARERQLTRLLVQRDGLLHTTETPSKSVMGAERSAALSAAIDRLPDEYRRIILLRNIERCAFTDIGEAMSCTPSAARKLWLRAVDRLREMLDGTDECC